MFRVWAAKCHPNLVSPGHQIVNNSLRIGGESFRQNSQQMIQVSLGIQAVSLRSFQHGKDDYTGVGPGLGIAEKPVFSANHDRPDRVFHLIVADFNLTVVKERTKELPLVQGVEKNMTWLFWERSIEEAPADSLGFYEFLDEISFILSIDKTCYRVRIDLDDRLSLSRIKIEFDDTDNPHDFASVMEELENLIPQRE